MSDPASRLLRLLSLLQGRRFWTGSELSERLRLRPGHDSQGTDHGDASAGCDGATAAFVDE